MKIENAVANLYQSMIDNNKEQLESLLEDKLTYGHSAGLLDTKTSLVNDITSNKSRFTKIDLSNETFDLVHDDLAVVRHRLQGEFLTNNVPGGKADLGVLQVWHKHGGKWLLFARQAFKWVA